jgi:hypothetical protein
VFCSASYTRRGESKCSDLCARVFVRAVVVASISLSLSCEIKSELRNTPPNTKCKRGVIFESEKSVTSKNKK